MKVNVWAVGDRIKALIRSRDTSTPTGCATSKLHYPIPSAEEVRA
jgi:hypothetical protein